MSLLNLANPDSGVLWRTSFAALAVLGGVGVVLLDRPTASGTLSRLVHWGGVALYGAVAFVALFADAVAAGLGVDPLQIEAVLLSLLLFLGMNVAFSLLFEGATPDTQGQPDR